MFPFTPSYIKHGRQFAKDAKKLVAYKRDLVSESTLTDVEREIVHLELALAGKSRPEVEQQMKRLDEACGKLTKPSPDAAWRENVEVFLVAIVIALAVRTYFLQPFTIPTGSMQPTLNGILAKPNVPPPNAVTQVIQKVVFGRTYLNAIAKDDESISDMREIKRFFFFTYTEIITSKRNTYLVHAGQAQLAGRENSFQLAPGTDFKKGEPIVQGYVDTGDHVFVDKMTYHFKRPTRGDVFVFTTKGIELLTTKSGQSQYYIKRLAGVPNDDLRIDPPYLFVNGNLAQEKGFQRVMRGTREQPADGYRGYGAGMSGFHYLLSPDEHFEVPSKSYFALGDNSYNSQDSRFFGTVPQENLAGRALFVYYPFTRHFGRIW
jgi:signal peptidase I